MYGYPTFFVKRRNVHNRDKLADLPMLRDFVSRLSCHLERSEQSRRCGPPYGRSWLMRLKTHKTTGSSKVVLSAAWD